MNTLHTSIKIPGELDRAMGNLSARGGLEAIDLIEEILMKRLLIDVSDEWRLTFHFGQSEKS